MNDVAVLTRPEGRDHCRGCLMQRRITTAVCVFTCIFAFSCCVYCTWIIQTSCCDKKKTSASDGHKNEQNITPSRRVPQSFEEISQEEKLLVRLLKYMLHMKDSQMHVSKTLGHCFT